MSRAMDFLRALSKTSSDQVARKASKLLELPVELRLQIFNYVLQDVFLHVTPRPGAYAYAKWTYLLLGQRDVHCLMNYLERTGRPAS